eukprot:5954490-Pyramimonas_sp.AAC.1
MPIHQIPAGLTILSLASALTMPALQTKSLQNTFELHPRSPRWSGWFQPSIPTVQLSKRPPPPKKKRRPDKPSRNRAIALHVQPATTFS